MTKTCPNCSSTYRNTKLICDDCGAVLIKKNSLTTRRPRAITQRQYQTQSDKISISALQKIPLLKQAISAYLDWWLTPQNLAEFLGNGVELNEQQLPEIYSLLQTHCERLSIPVPRLFVAYRDPFKGDFGFNAFTTGTQEKPVIFFTSSILDNFKEDEISFILGHECGHIQSNHVVYHSMARHLIHGASFLTVFSSALLVPLLAWVRESEYSADIAGLLCCGNAEAACRSMLRLTIGSDRLLRTLDLKSFLRQRQSLDGFHAKWNLIFQHDHPYLVERMYRLMDYSLNNQMAIRNIKETDSHALKKIQSPLLNEAQSAKASSAEKDFCDACGFPMNKQRLCPFCDKDRQD